MTTYLAQHPDIGMCAQKETQYFATDLYTKFGRGEGDLWIGRDGYLALFKGAQGRKRIGEASVWYLYSAAAPHAIAEFSPDADIIVMLRNPLDALPSLHSQFVFVGLEPVEDLEAALALDEERERSGTPPGFPPRSYRSAARYSEQLKRYLEVFGPDRIHVVVYENFRRRTRESYADVCSFLGVDPEFVPELDVVNANKRVRSRRIRKLVRTPPSSLRRALRSVTSQELRRRTGRALKRWNARIEPRAPVPGTVIDALRPLVAEQVRELDDLAAIDVSCWLDPREAAGSGVAAEGDGG
jgi:Sulfotransferase family